jgi:hypothetical protein
MIQLAAFSLVMNIFHRLPCFVHQVRRRQVLVLREGPVVHCLLYTVVQRTEVKKPFSVEQGLILYGKNAAATTYHLRTLAFNMLTSVVCTDIHRLVHDHLFNSIKKNALLA